MKVISTYMSKIRLCNNRENREKYIKWLKRCRSEEF